MSEERPGIFRLLVKHAPDGLVAGELSRLTGIPKSNLSFHLKSIACSGKGMLLADGNKTVTLMSGDAADKLKNSSFAVSDGAAVAVKYGDVNENSKINIVDAQIALDVGKSVYKGTEEKVSVAGLLAADVNHDNVVDAKDAYSIQIYVHYNAFTVPAGN